MLQTKMKTLGMSNKEQKDFMKYMSDREAHRVLDEILSIKHAQDSRITN